VFAAPDSQKSLCSTISIVQGPRWEVRLTTPRAQFASGVSASESKLLSSEPRRVSGVSRNYALAQ
jgi:hypothetical protein